MTMWSWAKREMELTATLTAMLVLPPWTDSGFECIIGLAGKDDVLFIFVANIFVRENVLRIDIFASVWGETPSASMAAFSMSEFVFRNLKLSLGRRYFMVDFPLDDEGSGDPMTIAWLGLGNGEKFTLLGVWIGDGGMLIITESSADPSVDASGIFLIRLCLSGCWLVEHSSTISLDSPI